MEIKILGSGCPKCRALESNARDAVKELGIEADIVKITKIKDIVDHGVMVTPALIVDGKLVSAGKVLKPDEIKRALKS